MSSMACAATSSLTAATARIGSPTYTGSQVTTRSGCAEAATPSPSSTFASAVGRSSGVRIAFTPSSAFAPGQVHGDARVRHLADEELGEEHALGAVVFRVLRAARDLRVQIGRRVVLAYQLRHVTPSGDFPRRASSR